MSSGRPQLLVVTSEGQFLVFNVDLDKGGEERAGEAVLVSSSP